MMIDVVLPEERFAYASLLMQMHQDRKTVFVDRLGWQLPSAGSWLEVDDFDNNHTVYLLARSPQSGSHEGSVRLLPSTAPHMLQSIFRDLCSREVPVGEDCWEISRLVTPPPSVAGRSIIRVHRLLALALVEFAVMNGIKRYTVVIEAHRVPALLSIGWQVLPLGFPTFHSGQHLQALQVAIEDGTLQQLRSRLKLAGSVLRAPIVSRQAA